MVKTSDELAHQVLPSSALVDAASRLNKLKRHQDLLAHYDVFEFGFLLPCTAAGACMQMAREERRSVVSYQELRQDLLYSCQPD